MLEPTIQTAIVVIVSYLLKLGADAVGLPLDEGTLTAVAVGLVGYIISKFTAPAAADKTRSLFSRG